MGTFIQSILSEFSTQGASNDNVLVANGNAQAPAMAYHLHVPRIELTVKGALSMLLPNWGLRIPSVETTRIPVPDQVAYARPTGISFTARERE